MIQAANFMRQARERGFNLFTGVPCSYLKPFINYAIDSTDLAYIGAANEGDAVAIASGAELAGRRAVVMFQNSGLGNAVNPLTSLNTVFRIPALLIVTWRGEPGGAQDEPQHELMGQITREMFDTMRLPWAFFPRDEDGVAQALEQAVAVMDRTGLPFGLIMEKDSVAPHPLRSKPEPRPLAKEGSPEPQWPAELAELPSRSEALRVAQNSARPTDAVIATTGFTGRALYALEDRPNQLYMVGSMGCASSLGLGLAVSEPRRRVIVIDGDGAALMRLGAMATIGYERPPNLIHILLDNEMHESTGGQSTVSHSVDFAAIARGCGYPRVIRAGSLDQLAEALGQPAEALGQSAEALGQSTERLTFIHVKTRPGEVGTLPRPAVAPRQVAERFRKWLRQEG
jgi:phosphonopyruvate decarboxylase